LIFFALRIGTPITPAPGNVQTNVVFSGLFISDLGARADRRRQTKV